MKISVVVPAKAGTHVRPMDSRFRGNDVIFRRAEGDEGSPQFAETATAEILRFAQNDRARVFRRPASHETFPALRRQLLLKTDC